MLQGFDENGNLKGVKVSKNGEVFVKIGGSSEDEGAKVITESKETTLYAGV